MAKLGMGLRKDQEEEAIEASDELKIFYCSRTHSQLSQFANELRRVHLPPVLTPADENDVDGSVSEASETLKYLTLGSRKNLCINPKVNKLGSAAAINERCVDLQQAKTPSDRKCSFLPSKDTEHLTINFRDHALAKVRDIEDLGRLGHRLGVCPYYASRQAIKPCEIVTLPYPLLFQKSAREALGISLKDHVVIIDEAHNLMDAVSNIYSVSVSLNQLQRSRAQLGVYLQKFRTRLKGKNRGYVTQTVRLIDSLTTYLKDKVSRNVFEGVAEVGDLLTGKGVDQINLFKLMRYLQESKLARKVDGYSVYAEQQQNSSNQPGTSEKNRSQDGSEATTPVLTHIQSFFLSLTNPSAEGRFFYFHDENAGASLKYMLLDPTFHFKDIVEESRAVVLAGGTMSPMEDYLQHLFSYLPKARITTLSCDHVVSKENLVAIPVIRARSGRDFEFTFEKRNKDSTVRILSLAASCRLLKLWP